MRYVSRRRGRLVNAEREIIGVRDELARIQPQREFLMPRRHLLKAGLALTTTLFWPYPVLGAGYAGTPIVIPQISGPTYTVGNPGSGPGGANDVSLLQTAFNNVKATGGTLKFPPNALYTVGSSGTSPKVSMVGASPLVSSAVGSSKIRIFGNGSTIKAANGSLTSSQNQTLLFENLTDLVIERLHVDGNRANRTIMIDTGSHNYSFISCHRYAVIRCDSDNAPSQDGFANLVRFANYGNAATFPSDSLFYRCRARNNSRLAQFWQTLRNGQLINGEYNLTNGNLPKAGLDLEPDAGNANPGIQNALVRGVKFSGNDGKQVNIARVASADVTGVTIEGSRFEGAAVPDTTRPASAIDVGGNDVLISQDTFEDFGPQYSTVRSLINFQNPGGLATGNNTVNDCSFNNVNARDGVVYVHSVSTGPYTITNNRLFPAGEPFLFNGNPGAVTASGNTTSAVRTDPSSPNGVPPWAAFVGQDCLT